MKKIKLMFIMIFAFVISKAQTEAPEMADALRANGKIYVVIVVIGIIFTGIVSYLIFLDRKITKLEKK